MRVDFEVEEKERELAQARQQAIIRNGFIMFALAIAFIGYLFFSRRIQMQNAQERANQARELERLVAERTQELQEQIRQVTAAENARVTLERQLAEAEKLRILGQLTGGVAQVEITRFEAFSRRYQGAGSYHDLILNNGIVHYDTAHADQTLIANATTMQQCLVSHCDLVSDMQSKFLQQSGYQTGAGPVHSYYYYWSLLSYSIQLMTVCLMRNMGLKMKYFQSL